MSELAFDEDGQHFQVDDEVVRWRIRRFNNPGKPGGAQVVYGDGLVPLYLDVNTTAEEFRQAVGGIAGRYRLDGVDVRGRLVEGVPPAYLVINGPAMAGGAGAGGGAYCAPPPASSSLEYAVVEMARANAEAIKAVTDKFSGVCDSVAKVLAAADGAALPRRAPLGPLLVDQVDQGDDEDDEDERNAAPQPAAQPTVTTVLTQIMQMVQAFMQISSGSNPAKVGAVLGQVVETAKVAEAIGTASEPGAPPATDEPTGDRDVRAATSANINGTHVNGTHATSAQREAARPRPSSPGAGIVPLNGAPAMTPTHTAAAGPPGAADPMAHFGQIMAALTPEEQAHVQYVITRLSVLDLIQWHEQLAGMSVADGAAKIRAELARVPTEKEKAA